MALARGASLAAANAQLGAPRTVAMLSAQDPPSAARKLAYSAEAVNEADPATGAHRESAADSGERRSRKSVLAVVSVTMIFVGGVVALALALAVGIRPHADQRPDISKNVVAPVSQPPPPPSAVPAPEPAAPSQAPAPPQQVPSSRPKDDGHWDDWLHRHLGQIPAP